MTRALSRRAPHVALLLALLMVACSDDRTPEVAPQSRDLAADDVALVGVEHIDAVTVAAIAKAQGVSLAVARDRAIRDALFAVEARARGQVPRIAESSLLARTLLHERRRQLDSPPTDDELAAATRDHWLELDRPEGFRVVHAVAVLKAPKGKTISDEKWSDADAVAARIAAAAGPAAELARARPADQAAVLAALQHAVKVAGAGGLEVKVEALQPVAADGRVIAPTGGSYAKEFAAAVARLGAPGDVTPPFRSPFGVHVAILLERTAPRAVPTEERRALVHDEVIDKRLAQARRELAGAHASTVELADNATALLELVQVSSPSAPPATDSSPDKKSGAP